MGILNLDMPPGTERGRGKADYEHIACKKQWNGREFVQSMQVSEFGPGVFPASKEALE